MGVDNFMSAAAKWILVIALAAVAVVVLLFGGELTAGQVLGAGTTGTGRSGDAGFGEFGGYLTILILVDIGLGTVVAWMLFGNRE
jgi:hypothetical protein